MKEELRGNVRQEEQGVPPEETTEQVMDTQVTNRIGGESQVNLDRGDEHQSMRECFLVHATSSRSPLRADSVPRTAEHSNPPSGLPTVSNPLLWSSYLQTKLGYDFGYCNGQENPTATTSKNTLIEGFGEVAFEALMVQPNSSATILEDDSSQQTMEKWALDNAPPPVKVRREGETSEESTPKELSPPPSPKRMREVARKGKVFSQGSI